MLKKFTLIIFVLSLALGFISSCGDDDNPSSPAAKDPKINSLSKVASKVLEQVTIFGEGFGASQGTSYVTINNIKAEMHPKWTDTEIIFQIPTNASSGAVVVHVGDKVSNGINYTIIQDNDETPFLQTLSKDTIEIDEVLTIFGGNFGSSKGDAVLSFNGVNTSDFLSWSNTEISVKVPQGSSSGKLTLTKSGKTSNFLNYVIKVYYPPVIESFNKDEIEKGDILIIKGKNFAGKNTYVRLNSLSLSGVQSWSDTEIRVVIPNEATEGNVIVYANGQTSNSKYLKVKEASSQAPIINSIDKKVFKTGVPLKITGSNFGITQAASFVSFGTEKAVTYSNWANTEITVIVPDNAKTGSLTVTVAGKTSNAVAYTIQIDNDIIPTVAIKGGTFKMGTSDQSSFDAYPQHNVTVSDFYMAETEVTQAQWKVVMSSTSNPSQYKNDKAPVEQVEFHRAAEFCNKLSQMEGLTPCYTIDKSQTPVKVTCDFNANGFRLPTEAEWEYACRAGSTTEYGFSGDFNQYVVCAENQDFNPKEVKSKKPNAFGLYDMHGNVAEWVWDWYQSDYYSNSPSNNPTGPNSGELKVIRGGSYQNGIDNCTATIRTSIPPIEYNFYVGFRVVRKK